MKTSVRILSAALALTCVTQGWTAEPVAAKPNIVVILADDLGYGDLGCYGATAIATPNIDRMCQQGVRFTDAHAPAAICQPSRYGLLTGRYYWRRTTGTNRLYFADGEVTLPGVLNAAGYATACIGKWHLGLGDGSKPLVWEEDLRPGPLEVGFDYFFGTPRSHNEPPFVYMEDHQVIGADPKDPISIIPAARTTLGYGHGISIGGIAAHRARPDYKIGPTITERAVDWIGKQTAEKPFFLYLPFVAPHVPLTPSSRFQGTSKAGVYGDFVQELDWCVGQVLDRLEQRGLASNTLVYFTSDNGACLNITAQRKSHRSNNQLLGQKTDGWEGGHRVPFIVRYPGVIPAGTTTDRLISLTDIMATSLAAAGVVLPAGAAPDSLDQGPVLRTPSAPAVRTEMILQSVGGLLLRSGPYVYMPVNGSMGFTAHPVSPWGSWKEWGFRNSDFDDHGKPRADASATQLYDVVQDPGQQQNLAISQPEVLARLAARFAELVPAKTNQAR
jgi:arylsulfatase A